MKNKPDATLRKMLVLVIFMTLLLLAGLGLFVYGLFTRTPLRDVDVF